MSKAGRARRKRAKGRKARSAIRQQRQRRKLSKWLGSLKIVRRGVLIAWAIVLGTLTVLAALAQIYFSAWQLSLTPGEARRESDPLSAMFVLQNDGQFAAYDVQFVCLINHVSYPHGIGFDHSIGDNRLFNVPQLEAGAATSAPCYVPTEGISLPPSSVDVTLTVSYRPSFYPFRKVKYFRFVTEQKDGGGFIWRPMTH